MTRNMTRSSQFSFRRLLPLATGLSAVFLISACKSHEKDGPTQPSTVASAKLELGHEQDEHAHASPATPKNHGQEHAKPSADDEECEHGEHGHARPGATQQHAGHEGSAAAHQAAGVKLNDGKRWDADDATRSGVAKLHQRVQAALTAAGSAKTPPGPAPLQEAYQEIFRNCRMQGPAHEQLHQFLIPIGAKLAQLEGAASNPKEVLQHLDKHLAHFSHYFK